MGYVVDLTVIMRAVFQASRENEDSILQRERVEAIVDRYEKSGAKRDIHESIRGFVQEQFPFPKSTMVEKIESLIIDGMMFTQ